MAHGILQKSATASLNVDSYNRTAVASVDVDSGNIVILTGLSTTAGEGEVWTAVTPSTSDGLTGVWMAGEPEVNLTASAYKGIDPDPRNFVFLANKPFSVFKPQLNDIVVLTADNMSGAKGGSDTYVNATNSTGGLKLVWGTSQTSSVFSMKLIATTYISIGTGAIDTQRVTAYKFVVVGL